MVPADVHLRLKAVEGLRKGRSGAKEGRKVRPVRDAHVDAVRPFVSRQVWAMIELQRLTGMRSGEAVMMRTADLDRSGSVWVYSPPSHKGEHRDHERRIFIGPKAQEILTPRLRPDRGAFLFQPTEAQVERWAAQRAGRKTPMTPSQRKRTRKARPRKSPGCHYTTHSYYRAIRDACRRAGVPRWHPHQLRHSSATRLRSEFGLEVARIILGHTSSAVTETYAEADHDKAIDIMSRVG
jgi:integrase